MMCLSRRRLPSVAAAIFAAIGLFLISGQPVHAGPTVYEVTITEDRNDTPCTKSCSLRESIIAANADPGPGLIVLEEDTYELTITGAGENAAMAGDLDIHDDLTIEGKKGAEVIIDGDGDDGVFGIGDGAAFILRNVTVQGGGSPASTDLMTGGIHSFGSLTLESVIVRDNHTGADDGVGGVSSRGTLTMRASEIIDNSTPDTFNGTGGLFADGPTSIEDSRIAGNVSTGTNGVAGVWIEDSDTEFTNVEIAGNHADGVGLTAGLYMQNMPVTLNDVSVIENTADGDNIIAGIWAQLVELNLNDSFIARNEANGPFPVGGMYAYGSLVEISGTSIEDNTANGVSAVGGLMMDGDSSPPVRSERSRTAPDRVESAGELMSSDLDMTDTDVTGNNASGEDGVGGVRLQGAVSGIQNVAIAANEATGEDTTGGILNNGPLDMRDSAVVQNQADGKYATGGMFAYGDGMVVERVLIAENEATGLESIGGLAVDGPDLGRQGSVGPTFLMYDSTVSGNTVNGDNSTAGVDIWEGSVAHLERVTVSGNAGPGVMVVGGIYNAALAELINVTVSGNTAGTDGVGGILNDGSLSIEHSTVVFNVAQGPDDGAGGMLVLSTVQVKNSIFAGNILDGSVDNCFVDEGEVVSIGGNIDSNDQCNFNQPSDEVNVDPGIGSLDHNGGYVETHALLSGSAAIDAAVDCPPPNEDARGAPRPGAAGRVGAQGAACDSGAYEFGSSAPVDYTQGDVDCDDDVDSVDALKQLRHVAGLTVPQTEPCPDIGTEVASLFGDVDCDDDVDSVDALKVLRHVASLSVAQTEPCSDIGGPLD